MKNIGKPCAGEPHARFDEGGQARACSLLYPLIPYFPIEKLWTSYGELVSVTKTCLAGLSQQDRRAVLHDNAARIYRLESA